MADLSPPLAAPRADRRPIAIVLLVERRAELLPIMIDVALLAVELGDEARIGSGLNLSDKLIDQGRERVEAGSRVHVREVE